MDPVQQFCLGFAGSVAAEIVTVYRAYLRPRLPSRYSLPGYWCVRALLALTAGGLAVAYDIGQPLGALAVGAAAPIIVDALKRKAPPAP